MEDLAHWLNYMILSIFAYNNNNYKWVGVGGGGGGKNKRVIMTIFFGFV